METVKDDNKQLAIDFKTNFEKSKKAPIYFLLCVILLPLIINFLTTYNINKIISWNIFDFFVSFFFLCLSIFTYFNKQVILLNFDKEKEEAIIKKKNVPGQEENQQIKFTDIVMITLERSRGGRYGSLIFYTLELNLKNKKRIVLCTQADGNELFDLGDKISKVLKIPFLYENNKIIPFFATKTNINDAQGISLKSKRKYYIPTPSWGKSIRRRT